MESAPAPSARRAASTGSGYLVPRAWRRVATWSMFTPRAMPLIRPMGSSSRSFSPGHGAHHTRSLERLAVQVLLQGDPEQALHGFKVLSIIQCLVVQRKQGPAADEH